jgi:hypothetical protein
MEHMMVVKTRITCPPKYAGRVLLGPCKVRQDYYRLVSEKGGSGRIESYDLASRTWSEAPESITFDEVWRAPRVSAVALSRAGSKGP